MKNNISIKYVFIIIVLCFIIMGNTNVLSKLILSNVRNEVFLLASTKEISNHEFLEDIFPAYGANENYNSYNLIDDNNYNNDYLNSFSVSTQLDSNQSYDFSNSEIENYNITETDIETTEAIVEIDEDMVLENEATQQVVAVNVPTPNIGINYTMEQLNDFEFLINNCYTIDGSTSITSEDINIENMMQMDLSMDLTGDEYKVLIYHTHGSEAFIDSRPGVKEDTIIGVGDELTRILEEDYGIKTYHDRTVYDIVDGELDRNYAYNQSGAGIDKILEQYPSIEVVLDIHRDGVRDDVHLMKVVDGKPTAQIMFFNGVSRLNDEGDLGYLHNPNLSDNLGFSLQMHLKGKAMYGDLMRKIYIGGYCYNLDRKPRASLIEVGAQTNTVEEAKNAMIPLAGILYRVLSGS